MRAGGVPRQYKSLDSNCELRITNCALIMEIGISTASLFLRMYNEDAVVKLNELDARVAEVFLETFSEYTERYGKKLNKRLGDVKVHSVHVVTTQYEPQLFGQNLRGYEDAMKMFEGVLKCAKAIGATNYTLHGRAYFKKRGPFEEYDHFAARLNEMCDLAETYGVSVCLENVYWCMYNRPGFFTHLKDKCPKLRTCLDIKQARLSGYDALEYVEEMAGRINTVHLSDYDEKTDKMCLPGKGDYDFTRLFKALKNVGFDGNMLIEVYKDDYRDYSEFTKALEYLRQIKDKVF